MPDIWPERGDFLLACLFATAAALPGVCGSLLLLWRFLDLPEVHGEAMRMSRRIWYAMYASLGLLCLCAPLAGTAVRAALVAEAIVATLPLVTGVTTRRTLHNFFVLSPIIWRYVAIDKWAQYTKLSKEDKAKYTGALDDKYAPQVFKLMVEQGGLYVKGGQFLSIIPDGILPQAYMDQFRKMQGEVTSMPIERVRAVLNKAYGRPLEEVFSSFEDKPLGAASIGQVHRARLKSDGSDVVVKVQHPNIRAGARADLWTLRLIANTVLPDIKALATHAQDWITKELDFKLEASVLRRVHDNLCDAFPKVNVPKPVEDLCTPEVVVMSFVPGISLLQVMLRVATVVFGERARKALQGLIGENGEEGEEGGVAAARAVRGVASLGAAGACLLSTVLAWRRRRAILRGLRRAFLVSGAAGVVAAAAILARQPRRGSLSLMATLPSRATLVRLVEHALAHSRSATNVGISLYNRAADVVGLSRLSYRKGIPIFDPVGVATEIWKVQGHQLFVDGLFNSDTHPGNFLIDEKTGSLGLLDFGQACEASIRYRVLVARAVVALNGTDEREIALRHAHLGYRSKRMTVAVLAAHARIKFGHMTIGGLEGMLRHFDRLAKWDPLLEEPKDPTSLLTDRMVALLRGTTAMLGAPLDQCCPPAQWLPYARAVLAKHNSEVEEPDFCLDDSLPEPTVKGGFAIG